MKNRFAETLRVAVPALFLSLFLFHAPAAEDKRPNILFLLTDDQRPDTIRALGNDRIHTPNIDRLVAGGLAFSNAYIMGATSMAVCTPSRACLFSGRTLWNLDSQGPWDFEISESYSTLTEVFLKNGYTCFATGKNDPGFGQGGHFERSFNAGENLYFRGGHRGQDRTPLFSVSWTEGRLEKAKQVSSGRFNADHFADACVKFLESREGEGAPFFAYVSFMTPHDPLNCPEEYLRLYQPGDMALPPNFLPEHPFDAGVHHIRDEKLMKRPLTELGLRERLARYYALVSHTDSQIGRILDALEKSGHAKDTIVVFSSDNGLALGSHGLTGKQNVYEHSVKVPLLLSGPGIPAGESRDHLCYLYDIFPTLCERAQLDIPATVQFRSFNQAIEEPNVSHRDHLYFGFMSWQRAIRDSRYKLIEYCVDGNRRTQLFDLKEDPAETENLAEKNEMASTLARLRKRLEGESEQLNDRDPFPPHVREMSEEFWSAYQKAAR